MVALGHGNGLGMRPLEVGMATEVEGLKKDPLFPGARVAFSTFFGCVSRGSAFFGVVFRFGGSQEANSRNISRQLTKSRGSVGCFG